ncbi:LysR family transcriptional regulator [Paludibacterium yongneupense]|uniref:LysR family transcriptional regulator n=1 Tax=Paludibacterium yongneupense TaxID=400061 RepID=UPI001B7F9E6F|nr:LysR family transcriptional regulator [Paludibacterium yongneupense]
MKMSYSWESIDVHLLQILRALLTECSVSNAARRLNLSQPAVSTALRRLRDITGDPLLVRSRNGMTPTERATALLEPVKIALQQIETIAIQQIRFNPAQTRRVFNIATPDYLNASLLSHLVGRLRQIAPLSQIAIHSLGPNFDAVGALENGELDVVVGNWPQPPEQLRMMPLFEDDVVCLMRAGHPLAERVMDVETYLAADHVLPSPYSVGQRGVIDLHLARERLKRNVAAYVPYFNMVPYLLAQSDMIFSGPRHFAEYFCQHMPLIVREVPVAYPPMNFYLLWHDRTHTAEECRWLRDQIVAMARSPVWRATKPPLASVA